MTHESILKDLGLSDKEARTYLAILELGSSTIKPIADRAGMPRSSIYNFIDNLVSKGLISKTVIRGRTRYQVTTPARLVDIQRERLRLLEENIPSFFSLFNALDNKPRIHFYEGPSEMKYATHEEIHCKKEALYIWPTKDIIEMLGGTEEMEKVNRARIANGVFVRSIRFRDKNIPFPTSSHGTENFLKVRFAPADISLSMGMAIFDTGKVSFFSSSKEGWAVMIESKELQEMMTVFYEMLWAVSEPAKYGEG